MLAITIEKNEIGPYLQVLAERASDWSQPITKVLESGLEDARAVISGGGSSFGWAPTSPWTLKVDEVLGRARQGQLQETGGLLNSLRVFAVSPSEGEAGTDSPVARYQQEGTSRTFFLLQLPMREFGGYGIPPRPFLFQHEEKFPEYDAMFLDHLMAEGEGNV